MAIICGIVQLFDHIFFQGLQQPYPKFSSKLLLFFFFYFTEQFLGFFQCHLIILSYAVCQTGGKLELVSIRAPKNSYRFLPYIRVFLVVSPNFNVHRWRQRELRSHSFVFLYFQLKKIPSRTNHFFRRWLKVERLAH